MDTLLTSDAFTPEQTGASVPANIVAQRCRSLEATGRNLVRGALAHPLVTAAQRERAEARLNACTGLGCLTQMVAWEAAIRKYIRAVTSGERLPKADQLVPVPAVREPRRGWAARLGQRAQARRLNQRGGERVAKEAVIIPMWETTPALAQLPTDLHWSGTTPIPGVGAPVVVTRYGQPVAATVSGYFHVEGFVGIVASYDKQPARMKKAVRAQCVFGRELAA